MILSFFHKNNIKPVEVVDVGTETVVEFNSGIATKIRKFSFKFFKNQIISFYTM